ncbi:MAG: hypothetical protein HRU20_01190 [Pseudomonadales bacterium]|nr:hypothetical protein [Pseudomonadales bacterium]
MMGLAYHYRVFFEFNESMIFRIPLSPAIFTQYFHIYSFFISSVTGAVVGYLEPNEHIKHSCIVALVCLCITALGFVFSYQDVLSLMSIHDTAITISSFLATTFLIIMSASFAASVNK